MNRTEIVKKVLGGHGPNLHEPANVGAGEGMGLEGREAGA